jgi:ADP-heptose:LPS heptosyltransferase
MERFDDQPLGPNPHIAVFSADKPGNFVVVTPLLRGLRRKYPGVVLDFFGGEITRAFEEQSPYIDARFSLYGGPEGDFLERLIDFVRERRAAAGPYALAINCDEFSELNVVVVTAIAPRYITGGALSSDFRRRLPRRDDPYDRLLADDEWNSPDFVARHEPVIATNYIGEIFCALARLSEEHTDPFRAEVPTAPPPFAVPDVLLNINGSRGAKEWPVARWAEVARWGESRGLTVGLLGHRREVGQHLYAAAADEDWLVSNAPVIDLRGQTTLPELAGAFARARAAACVDAGPLHVAAAVGCPTVAVVGVDADDDGASPWRLWQPRVPNLLVARSAAKCLVCAEHRFKNRDCLVPGHPCMAGLSVAAVTEQLERALVMSGNEV